MGVERPRLIIVDGQLPGIDILELCRRLKENPALSPLRILALVSDVADPMLTERLRGAGADDVLPRGQVAAELVDRCRVLLKSESPPAGA